MITKQQLNKFGLREDTPLAMMTIGQLLDVLSSWRSDAVAPDRVAALERSLIDCLEDGLTTRSFNILCALGAKTLGDLVRIPRMRVYKSRGFGRRSLQNVETVLDHYGLLSEWE